MQHVRSQTAPDRRGWRSRSAWPPRSPRAAPTTPPLRTCADGGDGEHRRRRARSPSPRARSSGEIYAQALEAEGFDVETKFNIGPRQQTIPALQDGSINLIPEYNGNLLAYYDPDYTERTTEEVDGALGDAVAEDKLRVLDSAEAEDKDAYVVTRATAEDNGLTSIGDLAKLVPVHARLEPAVRRARLRHPGAQERLRRRRRTRATSSSSRSRTSADPTRSRRSSTTPCRSPTSTRPRRRSRPRTSWSSRTPRT